MEAQHGCCALDDAFDLSADLGEYAHGDHQLRKQDGERPQGVGQFLAVNGGNDQDSPRQNGNGACDFQQGARLQLGLVGLKAAPDSVQDVFDIVHQAAHVVEGFGQAAHEFGDAQSDAAQGDAVEQIQRAAEIRSAQRLHNAVAQAADHVQDACYNGFDAVEDRLEHLEELAALHSGVHAVHGVAYAGPETGDRVDHLPDPGLYVL